MDTSIILPKFKNLCQHYFANIVQEIQMSLEYNHGLSFDTGSFGERVMFILCNTKGVPSNGGCAFDSLIKVEGKTANYAQTYECVNCGCKNNFYSPECWNCGGTDIKFKTDTRFGVDDKSHFKYLKEIPFYIMTVIKPLNRDVTNPKFSIETYRFETENAFFCAMLEKQLTAGSKPNKNFMPYGRDFMMSSPTLLLSATLDCLLGEVKTEVNFIGEKKFTQMSTTLLNLEECAKLGFVYKATKKPNRLTPTQVREQSGDMVNIEDVVEMIGVKQSTHGKGRGVLNRNDNLPSQ